MGVTYTNNIWSLVEWSEFSSKLCVCTDCLQAWPCDEEWMKQNRCRKTDVPNCVCQICYIPEMHNEIELDSIYWQGCMNSLQNPNGSNVARANTPTEQGLAYQMDATYDIVREILVCIRLTELPNTSRSSCHARMLASSEKSACRWFRTVTW